MQCFPSFAMAFCRVTLRLKLKTAPELQYFVHAGVKERLFNSFPATADLN